MAIYGYSTIVSFIAVVLLGLLASCGNDGQHLQARVDRALDDVDRDRRAVRSELIELRKDIDVKMLQLEEDLRRDAVPEDLRSDRQQQLRELEESRARVQLALMEIDNAEDSAWLEVRTRSKDLTRSVDKWFERQAEKEDLRS